MQNYEQPPAENLSPAPLDEKLLASTLPVTPDNPPWNSLIAFLVWLSSVILIAVLPIFFVFPYLISQGTDLTNQASVIDAMKNDPTVILLNLIAVLPAHLLTLLLAWLVVTKFKRFSFRETVGWQWNGFNFWTCLGILGGFFVVAAIVSYFIPEQETELTRILKSSRTAVYVVAFFATFTAPLVEEVVYRGIVYSSFQRSGGVPAAVALTTFLFAVVHFPQYIESLPTLILICLLSLILTLVRVRTGNLLPCVALHTAFNGIQSLLLIAQPYLEKHLKTGESPVPSIFQMFN